MSIMTFGSNEENSRVCKFVKVGLTLRGGETKQLTLFTVPMICGPLASQPIAFCRNNYEHLSGLDLADSSDGCLRLEVDILVGSDQYWDLITGKTRRGASGPVAIDTRLGWVLSGPTTSPIKEQTSSGLVTHTLRVDGLQQDMVTLDRRLKSFWELESFGVPDSDRSVYDMFQETVQFKNGRYEVALPWKDSHSTLSDNFQLSLTRLNGLLRQDKDVLQEYDSIIKSQIQQGIVEVVEHPESTDAEVVHYLPHHAVVRRDKDTTKLRIVYDASSKASGPSLNECLHAGPKFDQNILDILLRFRIHKVAIAADIERAFLMIAMTEKDRDVLRFLWVDDVSKEHPETIVLRFTRVVFGVSSSPFLLNATIRYHLEKHAVIHPDLVRKLLRSTYVDDIVTGAESEEAAYELYKKAKELLLGAGFNLRKFTSNSPRLRHKVEREESSLSSDVDPNPSEQGSTNESEETYSGATLGGSQKLHSGEQKILGVNWNVGTDQFVISLAEIARLAKSLEPTKRSIVSLVGRFYDPLGVLAPVVVKFKMFLQTLCEADLEWDQPLPIELMTKWQKLSAGLLEAQTISIPRCCSEQADGEVISYTLCGFCDASLGAYAAVIYLLMEMKEKNPVSFVAAKTRVSPLRKQTIPRLELLSASLLAQLISSVSQSLENELQLLPPRCFTDSKVALFWIKGVDKEWKPFVQNRVSEIRSLVHPDCWSHCSGRENPADLPSRGSAPLELSVNSLWREGPGWLCDEPFRDVESELPMPEECVVEMKTKDRLLVHGLMTVKETSGLEQIMN